MSLAILGPDDVVRGESGETFKGGLTALGRVGQYDLFELTPGETWALVRENVEPIEGIGPAGHQLWLAESWCLWREQRGSSRRTYTAYFSLNEEGKVLWLDTTRVEQFLNPPSAPVVEENEETGEPDGLLAEAFRRAQQKKRRS